MGESVGEGKQGEECYPLFLFFVFFLIRYHSLIYFQPRGDSEWRRLENGGKPIVKISHFDAQLLTFLNRE